MFAEMSERDTLLSYLSDAHKDAYGFRPTSSSWEAYNVMSLEELHAEADRLSERVADSIEEDEQRQTDAAVAFENRVLEVIAAGAGDRATAIRWIYDSEDITETVEMYGNEYAEFHFGLKFAYFTEAGE